LLAQGIITEKDGEIVILKPEAFEIVSSNSADTAGEKQEWLKQTPQSVDPSAKIKIQNETNTRFSHKTASETKNSSANGKTEFSKPAEGSTEKSVEKTHSSKFAEDPKHLEIIGSSRKKVTVDFSAFGDELRFDGEDVVISKSYYFQIRYNDTTFECVPTKNGYVCGEESLKDAVKKIARMTDYNPSMKEILESIESRLQVLKSKNEKRVKVHEYFAKAYPELWEEVKKKGVWYFIEKSEEYHVGDEDVKLLALMAFKMLFTTKRKRIGILVLGDAGSGKSHAIESIVSMIPEGYYYNVEDVTPKSIIYLGKKGSDYLRWKLLYLQEITNLRALKLLSMLMTSGRGGSLTVVDGEPVEIFLDYAPSVITSVVNIEEADSSQKTQILSRFIPVAIIREKKDVEKITRKIYENANRNEGEFNYDDITKLALLAWMTYTPKFAHVPESIFEMLVSSLPFSRTISLRITDFATFALQILAMLLNKDKVDEETLDLFKKYLLRKFVIASFGVSEVEIKLLKYLHENRQEKLKTSQIASDNGFDTSTAKELLMGLAGRGLVEFEKPGNVYMWSITDDGVKLLMMLEEAKEEEKKEEEKSGEPVIEKFEECLGFSLGAISYQLYARNEVSEEQLMKLFKGESDVVNKVEECLPVLGYKGGDGVFKK
jgi:predicted transcriptional regulator